MRVIYSDQHRGHDPPHQFNVDHLGNYSDSPERIDGIVRVLTSSSSFTLGPPGDYSLEALHTVHDPDYVQFLRGVWEAWLERGHSPGRERCSVPECYQESPPAFGLGASFLTGSHVSNM